MDRHSSIEKAEKLIIRNLSVIVPILIVLTFIYIIELWITLRLEDGTNIFGKIFFEFITFPLVYLGTTNFVVKLINEENTDVSNIVEILIKKPIQSYILSFCYVSITSMVMILLKSSVLEVGNIYIGIGIVVNGFLTVKFVLAIYIFGKGDEITAIGSLKSAWIRSKGYGLQITKIYLTVMMASFVFSIASSVISSLIAALFGGLSSGLEAGMMITVGSIMMAIVLIFENASFSYLAEDSFS